MRKATRFMRRMRVSTRRLMRTSVLLPLVLGVLLLTLFYHRAEFSFDNLVVHEVALRNRQQESPLTVFAYGFVAYFVACFVPGTNGKALVCGWLFGVFWGTVLVNGASTLAALLVFFVTRFYLHAAIESRYRDFLTRIRDPILRRGGTYLLTMRLVPVVPYTLLNPLMALTPLRARTFWWATQLGMLPSNCVFASVGANLPGLQHVRDHGWSSLVSWELVIALALLALLPLFARWLIHRIWAS